MKKLQLGALALATVLTLGGATTFASQNQNENKLGTTSIGATASTTATKATAEEIAQFESATKAGTLVTPAASLTEATKATKLTAEEIAQYEKMVKNGTSTTASTAATPTEAATTKK
ncbi:hypothetical protein [Clostridium sp. CF012]|uniref:hypothetical protein n=1 Tax=Clostridium sp. CF012 TaxID=2843319 RepID=UPI001C0BC34E|nr:hypothetical protein [Clostridium sp. CF012]MBU3142833.1 hypothetical protein [Clostridium sp. CF012]